MEFINFEVQPSFIANTLRNIGYNNYSAIADIIDNSVEPNVCSSYVKVDFETIGTGSAATIDKIATALNIPVSTLFNERGSPQATQNTFVKIYGNSLKEELSKRILKDIDEVCKLI